MSSTSRKKPPVRLSECRGCAAPIIFARLDTGKAIPLNPIPHPGGNVAARMHMGRLIGFVISKEHRPGPQDTWRLYPHHATCEALKKKPAPAPVEEEPLW